MNKCFLCTRTTRVFKYWRVALCENHSLDVKLAESFAKQEELALCRNRGHDWRIFFFSDGSKKGMYERCTRCHFTIRAYDIPGESLFAPYAYFDIDPNIIKTFLRKVRRYKRFIKSRKKRIEGNSEKIMAVNILYHLRYDLNFTSQDIENTFTTSHKLINSLIYAFPWVPDKKKPLNTIYTEKQRLELLQRIKERDGNMCAHCKSTKRENFVHHKNGNEQDYSEKNLITACKICHMAYCRSKNKNKYSVFFEGR